MCVYVCICMCVYIYIYIYIYIYCIQTYSNIFHTCVRVRLRVCVCVNLLALTYIHTYVRTYVHTYIHIHTQYERLLALDEKIEKKGLTREQIAALDTFLFKKNTPKDVEPCAICLDPLQVLCM